MAGGRIGETRVIRTKAAGRRTWRLGVTGEKRFEEKAGGTNAYPASLISLG